MTPVRAAKYPYSETVRMYETFRGLMNRRVVEEYVPSSLRHVSIEHVFPRACDTCTCPLSMDKRTEISLVRFIRLPGVPPWNPLSKLHELRFQVHQSRAEVNRIMVVIFTEFDLFILPCNSVYSGVALSMTPFTMTQPTLTMTPRPDSRLIAHFVYRYYTGITE